MASVAQPEISSELEKKDNAAAGEDADNNPEDPMDDDDENDDGGDGDDEDVEEDVVVQIGATYSCKRQDGSFHDAEIVKTRVNKQAGREEFFVHYVGLNRRQNEWVDKTRLVIPKPVKEGQVINSTDPGPAEEGKAPLKRKNDFGTSEAKKAKVDVEIAPSTNSAMASGDFAEELTCLLCSELFKDPVMVECGHNFCRNCADKAWNGQESFTCPDCKEVITEKRYTTNRALANLVKKTVGTNAALTTTKPSEKPKPSENCPEHDERLKLYCKDDGTLSCVICRDSLKHASHTFLPILDAVGVYRTELSAIVAPLEEALKVTEQLTSQQSEKVEQHKTNISECRQHIESEFEKLRTFLKEGEEKLLEQLQEQGENLLKEMESNMVKMQENQDNIKQTITVADERMNDADSISFLTGIKTFIEKCQEQQKDVIVAGNTLLSKDLCQGTFKGPIQYSIWKQMKSFIVPYVRRPAVWLIGDSYINCAAQRASDRPCGLNLGFTNADLAWRGIQGLKWSQVLSEVVSVSTLNQTPTVLVIHAGGNDLCSVPVAELISLIRFDFDRFTSFFADLIVVWSEVIPRAWWNGARNQPPIERARRLLNMRVSRHVRSKGGVVIRHRQLEGDNSELMLQDGVLLNDNGLDIFLSGLQNAVERALILLGQSSK
ncbi:nuclear factor 7, brain-like isoform X1 [Bufo gargarizans]|uniref:nuclear factor 7, brain-like isoform X1 n=1 Tax=Bufo gargarizans TaxID=30331 RepID=UPI001CF555B0|nr:nuclear factor 7, brain-like isoform X1 [Bufo gargarizans]